MHAALIRMLFKHRSVFVNLTDDAVLLMRLRAGICKLVKRFLRLTKYFANLTNLGFELKLIDGTAKAYMFFAESFKNVCKNGIPVLVAPIYIEIRRCFTGGI